jgi:hypothetical protein
MKKTILAFSLSLLAFTLSEANAVTSVDGFVDAYTHIDWNGLTVTGGVTPYTDFYSLSKAKTANVWDITTQPSWGVVDMKYHNPATYAESVFPVDGYDAAKSMGETGVTFISSESTVQLLPGSFGVYSAEARAMKGQTYYAASDSEVSFTIPYLLEVESFDSDNNNSEYGYARAWSWLRLYNWKTREYEQIAGTYTDEAIEGDGYSQDKSLKISYTAAAGSYLLLEAGADTRVALANSVPVPPSVLMLLTGCTSLFFMIRRKD